MVAVLLRCVHAGCRGHRCRDLPHLHRDRVQTTQRRSKETDAARLRCCERLEEKPAGTGLYSTVFYSTVKYTAVLYSNCILFYCTVLYSTVYIYFNLLGSFFCSYILLCCCSHYVIELYFILFPRNKIFECNTILFVFIDGRSSFCI